MDQQSLKKLLKTLGGGPRLAILAYLQKHRSASVGEIAQAIHRSHNTTSLQLSRLHNAGIIQRRRRGREVLYRLSLPQHPMTKQVLKEL
jgi:DNA-binding transcriptional ArsR family regulator